ncbi:toxin HigB-1 [Methylomarinovum caldicuralii]|uniref:Toxin HigB-1 n=1 Tax=Methylomarinovum caldicuralii TaxID=438856 RepID=A0AAU9CNT7_9GAMM|nr:type II toxin-antitoxin system RelE/ParE family toxin [Methylomarinovum caldicuralii]BCX81623.1 toxin HigB-1 [Methylomarinovum caldicuralii]
MIRSFRDKKTAAIFQGYFVAGLPRSIQSRALDKLRLIHSAASLDDLRIPPGNRLEALQGERAGQHSIRINRQWRICFRWEAGHAWDVEITDYH